MTLDLLEPELAQTDRAPWRPTWCSVSRQACHAVLFPKISIRSGAASPFRSGHSWLPDDNLSASTNTSEVKVPDGQGSTARGSADPTQVGGSVRPGHRLLMLPITFLPGLGRAFSVLSRTADAGKWPGILVSSVSHSADVPARSRHFIVRQEFSVSRAHVWVGRGPGNWICYDRFIPSERAWMEVGDGSDHRSQAAR